MTSRKSLAHLINVQFWAENQVLWISKANEYLCDIAITKAWDYWLATVSIFIAIRNNLAPITSLQKLLCHVFCFALSLLPCFRYGNILHGFPIIFQCVIFRPAGMYYIRMVADPDKRTKKRVNLVSYWPWEKIKCFVTVLEALARN